jgi:hypothetical protein
LKPHALSLAAALALLASSCNFNVFEPFDHPTSDAQLISAARACFNRGDYACAQQDYEKLSNNSDDIKNSEEAFVAIDQIGAGMGAFISAFGQSNISTGKAITAIANSVGGNAGAPARLAVYNAYQKAILVQDTSLKGLTRFVTAIAMAAELLAEAATSPGNLTQADLALSVSGCSAVSFPACNAFAPCGAPAAGTKLVSTGISIPGPGTLDQVSLADVQGTNASIEVFNASLVTIQSALTQMGVNSTQANINGFSGSFAGLAILTGPPDSPCYRNGLLSQGVGL